MGKYEEIFKEGSDSRESAIILLKTVHLNLEQRTLIIRGMLGMLLLDLKEGANPNEFLQSLVDLVLEEHEDLKNLREAAYQRGENMITCHICGRDFPGTKDEEKAGCPVCMLTGSDGEGRKSTTETIKAIRNLQS